MELELEVAGLQVALGQAKSQIEGLSDFSRSLITESTIDIQDVHVRIKQYVETIKSLQAQLLIKSVEHKHDLAVKMEAARSSDSLGRKVS